MRPRIILHSMTYKRDFGMMYILSKLLEHLGCDCIIANNTNLHLIPLRLWRPNAVFFVTLSHFKPIKRTFPDALLFHLSAEGGTFYDPAELSILHDENTIRNIHRFYLWGKGTYDLISRKEDSLESERKVNLKDKCMIVGSPRMDMCKYADLSRKKSDGGKINVGLVGNFYFLNNLRHNPFKLLAMHELGDFPDETGDQLRFQIRLCETYCKLLRSFGQKDYSFSIRPYPLEMIDSYKVFEPFAQINTYLEFTSWLTDQDIIIGSISTTVTQIAAAELPYINLDKMLERSEWEYGNILSSGLERHQPKTFDELLSMIKNFKDYKLVNPRMTEILDCHYRSSDDGSVLFRIAKDIMGELKNSKSLYRGFLPKSLVLRCMNIWSLYIEKRNDNSMITDYSYFRYFDAMKKAGAEFDGVLRQIISASGKVVGS